MQIIKSQYKNAFSKKLEGMFCISFKDGSFIFSDIMPERPLIFNNIKRIVEYTKKYDMKEIRIYQVAWVKHDDKKDVVLDVIKEYTTLEIKTAMEAKNGYQQT